MTPSIIILCVISLAVWAVAYRTMVRHPLDFAAVTLYLTAMQLILRPLMIGLGWDRGFPTDIFRIRDEEAIIVAAQQVVLLWLVAITIGYVISRSFFREPPPPDENSPLELHTTVLSRLMILFTIVSTLITLWLWSRYGGFSGLISANKVDKALLDLQWLRSFTILSTFVAGATYLSAVASGRKSLATLAFLLAVLNSVYSFSWGARDAIAITAFGLLAGRLLFNRGEVGAAAVIPRSAMEWWRRRRRLFRAMITILLLVASVFFLRLARDSLVYGDTLDSIEGESVARQLAVAVNLTQFDTMALLIEDWPSERDFIGGEQFFIGAVSFLPAAVYAPEEGLSPPSIQVAQHYLPYRENGWPMTPIGDWYMSWGLLGVTLGGIVSGAVIRLLQVKLHNFSRNPLVWMLTIVLAFRVMSMGVWINTIPRLMTFALPAVLVLIYVQRRRPDHFRTARDGSTVDDVSSPLHDLPVSTVDDRGVSALSEVARQVRRNRDQRRAPRADIEIERRAAERPETPPDDTLSDDQ